MHDEFYGDAKILATTLARLSRAPISAQNRATILAFATALQAEGVGRFRVTKYLYHLTEIASLSDVDPLPGMSYSSAVALKDFIDEHGQLQTMVSASFVFDNQMAVRLDYRLALVRFLSTFTSRRPLQE